jgi:acyl carrier protein
MPERALYDDIAGFFQERLNISGPSLDADLFESGILDSLTFVDLVMHMEQQFDIRVVAEELEPENFRSVEKIAAFVAAHMGVTSVGA